MKLKHAVNNLYCKFFKNDFQDNINTSYLYDIGGANWTTKGYSQFVKEAYKKNVIANRCISLISRSAASVDWGLAQKDSKELLSNHPILDLLHHPNAMQGGAEFFEALYAYKILSGNAFILSINNGVGKIKELHLLRPDRVEVVPGKGNIPKKYVYKVNEREIIYPVDQVTGYSDILHLKNFNPSDDWVGLSQVEAASYSIDIHNQASTWNKSLLENGARPSGAMIVKSHNNSPGYLTDQQFKRLVDQLEDKFMGSSNAGRPIVLEGGLDWKEMGYSPKDMDFVETKNTAAREIALAFGIPPQLLGIKGDSTYNNMQEARLAFWEETVLPLIDCTVDALNNWFVHSFGNKFRLSYNTNNISALSLKQDKIWKRINDATFMNDDEKRAAVGLSKSS